MKFSFIFLFIIFIPSLVFGSEYKLEKLISDLNKPWGMSFIDNNNLIVTQKSGDILKINLNTKSYPINRDWGTLNKQTPSICNKPRLF